MPVIASSASSSSSRVKPYTKSDLEEEIAKSKKKTEAMVDLQRRMDAAEALLKKKKKEMVATHFKMRLIFREHWGKIEFKESPNDNPFDSRSRSVGKFYYFISSAWFEKMDRWRNSSSALALDEEGFASHVWPGAVTNSELYDSLVKERGISNPPTNYKCLPLEEWMMISLVFGCDCAIIREGENPYMSLPAFDESAGPGYSRLFPEKSKSPASIELERIFFLSPGVEERGDSGSWRNIFSKLDSCAMQMKEQLREYKILQKQMQVDEKVLQGTIPKLPEDDTNMCILCLNKPRDHVFCSCGHLLVCGDCVAECAGKCPACRKKGKAIKIFSL